MTGRKTHEQQQRVIKGEEETKGGGSRFPAEEDLKASKGLRKAKAGSDNLAAPAANLADPDDRNILRGRNQESRGRGSA